MRAANFVLSIDQVIIFFMEFGPSTRLHGWLISFCVGNVLIGFCCQFQLRILCVKGDRETTSISYCGSHDNVAV